MSSDIRSIIERISAIEAKTTPASVNHGLNPQQRAVHQLPALFKPRRISALTNPTDPKHPMKNMMVGDSIERPQLALDEAMQGIEEDMLSKVKQDFADYLASIERKVADNLLKKTQDQHELQNKAAREIQDANLARSGLQQRAKEDSADSELAHDLEQQADTDMVAAQPPVKTVAMEDGAVLEIYGDQDQGFKIGRNGHHMPSKFSSIDHADMAIRMYQRHKQKQNQSQDYIDEA